jgi:hypothetical protein
MIEFSIKRRQSAFFESDKVHSWTLQILNYAGVKNLLKFASEKSRFCSASYSQFCPVKKVLYFDVFSSLQVNAKTHYKTTLLSTVGNQQYNKNRSETNFKNAAPILVM